MYWVVWSFDVKPEQVKAFERAYGPEGDWAQLFGRAQGYVGTELRRETDRRAHYLTIDRWQSREDYKRFKEAFSNEYVTLDLRCGRFTDAEQKIGDFESKEVPGSGH
jgi:heme-degrading monooxygenase HmoA